MPENTMHKQWGNVTLETSTPIYPENLLKSWLMNYERLLSN